MTGNEAIARGIIEAGAEVVSGYPGTPSTEVIINLIPKAKDLGIRVDWDINEKVALEIVVGAAWAGKKAELIYRAMAYQIAKEIGGKATVLKECVDAIVLTGNLLRGKGVLGNTFLGWLKERIQFIAPLIVSPGTDEMKAMAQGAIRVLQGTEKAQEYE